ncbi:terpenoid synthase [Panus rudis PR-1116 ss-1]|nr:terpenoid synthase [Panus rudis PR-1116 ss-1]
MLLNQLIASKTIPNSLLCGDKEDTASSTLEQADNAVHYDDQEYSSDSDNSSESDTDELQPAILARDIILQYFKRTGVDKHFSSRQWDPAVEEKVRKTIDSWNLGLSERVYNKYLATGLDIAATAYRHVTSVEVRAYIALNTFCTALFDDGFMGFEAMSAFAPRFFRGQKQMHPALDLFGQNLLDMGKCFTSYGANALVTSAMDFANSEMFLKEGKNMTLIKESAQYVEFIRLKEGFGEAYAIFIWPRDMCPDTKRYIQAFPDTMNFINLINDLFSYYKEAKAGESGTYLHSFGKVRGLTEPEVLQDLVKQTITVVDRIRSLLGEGIERDCWEAFASGYTQFHMHTDRYKLVEVLPEYF